MNSTEEPTDSRLITEFYAKQVRHRVHMFTRGNDRIEAAWRTVRDWPQAEPHSVLDLGCSIGEMCWRMSVTWPRAHIVGLDLTSAYIDIAERLFGSDRLEFVQGDAAGFKSDRKFNLVTMIDLYEHIALGSRAALHSALNSALTPSGAMILTCPTPRHLAWLRETNSEFLQPVDEDVTMDVLEELARGTETRVVYYRELDVYHTGDYLHAVLARPVQWGECTAARKSPRFRQRIGKLIAPKPRTLTDRMYRKRLVRRRLGAEWL